MSSSSDNREISKLTLVASQPSITQPPRISPISSSKPTGDSMRSGLTSTPLPQHLVNKLQRLTIHDPEYLAWLEALIDGHLGDLQAEGGREVASSQGSPTPGWKGRRRS